MAKKGMKKRNHYLSALYLRGWRDASTPHELIHRYTLGSEAHVLRNVKNVGLSWKLTISEPPALKPELVENHLEKWEQQTLKPFVQLRNNHIIPKSEDERFRLWRMFVIRGVLTPEQQKRLGTAALPVFTADLEKLWEAQLGEMVAIPPEPGNSVIVVRKTKELAKEYVDRNKEQSAKTCGLFMLYDVGPTVAYFASLKMRLHIARPPNHVVLPDSPVVMNGSNANTKKPTPEGEDHTIRRVPISASAFLSISRSYQADEVVTATAAEVYSLNMSLIESAFKYVFSSKADDVIAAKVLATTPKTTLAYE